MSFRCGPFSHVSEFGAHGIRAQPTWVQAKSEKLKTDITTDVKMRNHPMTHSSFDPLPVGGWARPGFTSSFSTIMF